MADSNFVYTPPKSLEPFFASQARVRLVRGPIGPVSADTEFLTPGGWKRVDCYCGGDSVGVWDSDTGALAFEMPADYIVAPADTLLEFRNKHSLCMKLSANHRVPHYNYQDKFTVCSAGEIAECPSTRRIPTNFTVQREGIDLSDDWLRLAVALNADGTIPPRGQQLTFTFRKERKKARFTAMLRRLRMEWSEYHNPKRPTEVRYTISRPEHPLFEGKRFAGQWWEASSEQLQLILGECLHWDGMPDYAEQRFTSTFSEDADFIQYAAHACGRRATIQRHDDLREERWAPRFTVFITLPDSRKTPVRVSNLTEISVIPTEDGKQYCFETSTGFFVARCEGRVFITGNSTKSTAMVMELFRRACAQEPDQDGVRRTRFAVVRNTLSQITETCLVTMRKALGPLIRYKVSEKKVILDFNDVYSELLFLPLDTPENIERLLSLELTGAWTSEFRQQDPEMIINVYSRCGRYPAGLGQGVRPTWYGLIAETNSFSEDSPWFDKLVVNKPESWFYLSQPGAYDEGADWLQYHEPTYYSDLLENNGPAWADQYIHNKISPSLSSQAVFAQTFDQKVHVGESDVPFIHTSPMVIGMDTGRNPAVVLGQLDPRGRLVVHAVLHAENMGVDTFIIRELKPYLAHHFPNAYTHIVCDPSARNRGEQGEKPLLQVINECGISAYLASTNNISPRLRAVEHYLNRRDGFIINPGKCGDLIVALRYGYRFPRDKQKALKELPDKSHPASDIADALQYLCLGVDSRTIGRQVHHDHARQQEMPREPRAAGWT